MLTIYGDDSWFTNTAKMFVDFMLEMGNIINCPEDCWHKHPVTWDMYANDIWLCVRYDFSRIVQTLWSKYT